MARILVVDDDADIRRLLTSILIEEGHKVLVAQDGEMAIEMIREDAPDAMVLDLMMPRVDGFMVLRQMKALGLRDSTRVLVLTAKTSEHDWERGYKLGADHYLTKPFDIDELTEAIKKVLAMTNEQLKAKREAELGKAQLLSKLESLFEDG